MMMNTTSTDIKGLRVMQRHKASGLTELQLSIEILYKVACDMLTANVDTLFFI